MAVIKTPFINNNATSSLQDFDKAVEVVSTYLSGDQSKFWSDRMATVAAGLVKPSRQQFDALKLMFDKKVPDAPKEINLHEQKQEVNHLHHHRYCCFWILDHQLQRGE